MIEQLKNDKQIHIQDLGACNTLKHQSCDIALIALGKIRDEKNPIKDVDKFLMKQIEYLRQQWACSDDESSESDACNGKRPWSPSPSPQSGSARRRVRSPSAEDSGREPHESSSQEF